MEPLRVSQGYNVEHVSLCIFINEIKMENFHRIGIIRKDGMTSSIYIQVTTTDTNQWWTYKHTILNVNNKPPGFYFVYSFFLMK